MAEGQIGYDTRHHAAVAVGGRRGHLYVVCLDTVHAVDAGGPDPHGGVGAVNRRTVRQATVQAQQMRLHGRFVSCAVAHMWNESAYMGVWWRALEVARYVYRLEDLVVVGSRR